ncbi:MAG TPA: RNA-binding protein [Thermoplasmatales archaeon]|nr:RNA-binding protein [Thermoplasmatales archaeon]
MNKEDEIDKTKMMVLPGDELSTSEELIPGDGTYEENGIIRAARVGWFYVDKRTRTAMVKPATSLPTILRRGDWVIGKVDAIKPAMVTVTLLHVIGKERPISGDTNAIIHVSEISNKYIEDPAEVFSLGDLFRARVIQVKPSIQLSTKGEHFGVIKALCTKCRYPLRRKGLILECSRCGNREKRKLADDYGRVDITTL